MMPKTKIALVIAAMLLTIPEAGADDLPRIDFQKTCRSRVQSVGQIGSGTPEQALVSCVNDEQRAQAALAAAWKEIPARYKAECIKPNTYSPSYSEWIACLELLIDLKSIRSKPNN